MVGDREEIGRQGGMRHSPLPADDYPGITKPWYLRARKACRVTPVAARQTARDGGQ
jgi:hypothetical protein